MRKYTSNETIDDLSILCTRDLMHFYPSGIFKDKDVRRLSIYYLQTCSIDIRDILERLVRLFYTFPHIACHIWL